MSKSRFHTRPFKTCTEPKQSMADKVVSTHSLGVLPYALNPQSQSFGPEMHRLLERAPAGAAYVDYLLLSNGL